MLDPYDYFEGVPAGQPHNIYEEHIRRVNLQIHGRFRLRDTQNPLNLSVNEFMKVYRMPQHEVVRLHNILVPYVPRRSSPQATPLITKLLVALSFFAGGSYQRMIGRSADSTVCQTSASRFIHEITSALTHPEILRRYIHFPMNHVERQETMARNQERLGMPRVLGYIDGTLIRIVPPPVHLNKQAYYCRKGFTAINTQIICNADLEILNVNARHPGSCNDQFIWTGSLAYHVVEEAYNEDRCWLLGDSGYTRTPWLHVPLPYAQPGSPEYDYTECHVSARNCVERCTGVLKARWRCLCIDRALTYRPTFAGHITVACCVLHNFCLSRGVMNPQPIIEDVEVEFPDYDDLPEDLQERALAEQQYLINYCHARKQQRRQLLVKVSMKSAVAVRLMHNKKK